MFSINNATLYMINFIRLRIQGSIAMGITTKDLAQICGVSRTTVHRALHDGAGRIHPDTREMILRVAKENDYRPDLLARGLDIPIVSVDNKIADGIPFVGIDQRRAMTDAAAKVIEKKYEKLIFVCPPMEDTGKRNIYVHRERLKGFKETVEKYSGIEISYLLDWNYREHVESVLGESRKTAFVCSADEFALEVMKRLKKSGKRAGRDYGIIGFDNIDILDYVTPRLTTISNSVAEVAETAVALLFELIMRKQEGKNWEEPASCKILPYRMVEGETI